MARKLPQRTCLGCQEKKSKREMIRIIRTPQGTVEIDSTGKKSGRGAYVCPDLECLERLKKGKRLERVLEVSLPPSIFEELHDRIVQIQADVRR
ncbi:MAG: RNase P modulator RnpM [Bacillota bacterium]|jgi:predicted RNA-binding protein YlxR (DUF448 family)